MNSSLKPRSHALIYTRYVYIFPDICIICTRCTFLGMWTQNFCIYDRISSPTYKNVVTQKVQLFRRAKNKTYFQRCTFEWICAILKCRISGVRTIKLRNNPFRVELLWWTDAKCFEMFFFWYNRLIKILLSYMYKGLIIQWHTTFW